MRIKSAAISVNGTVYTGFNHAAIIREYGKDGRFHGGGNVVIQGFYTDYGTFVDRKTALKIAREAGQLKRPIENAVILFSEDLDKETL